MIIQVSIDKEDYKRIEQHANRERLSISSMARTLIISGLEAKGK